MRILHGWLVVVVTALCLPGWADDPFFGIDGAMSWLTGGARAPERGRLVEMLRANGVSSVRERLAWAALEPNAGKFNWQPDYDEIRNLLKHAGISVLDVFHDAPAWAGATKDDPYPQDLAALERAWRTFADRWQQNWCGWEVWNEPDIGFSGNQPFDRYLPILKAMNHAAGVRPVPIVGLVSAREIPEDFHRLGARSKAWEWMDVVSFHSYGSGQGMEEIIAGYRALIRDVPRPIWMTEAGYSFSNNGELPPDPKELHASAWQIAVKAVEAKACGVERFYPFVFSNYDEGPFSFSMLDKSLQPHPSLLAYFETIRQLSGKEYVGDLKMDGVLKARVFADDAGDAVVAVIAPEADGGALPQLPVQPEKTVNLYGKTDTSSGGIWYLAMPLNALEPHLIRDTRAAELLAEARAAAKFHRKHQGNLILQTLPVAERFYKITSAGYYLDDAAERTLEFPVRLWNLGDAPLCSGISFSLSNGAGMALEGGLLPTQEIAPGSSASFTVPVSTGKFLAQYPELYLELRAGDDQLTVRFLRNQIETAVGRPVGESGKWYDFTEGTNWISQGAMWYGVKDLSCKFNVAYSQEKLICTVAVTDNIHAQEFAPARFWMGDSVQFAIRALPGEGSATSQFTVALTPEGAVSFTDRRLSQSHEAGAQAQVVRDGDVATYRIEILPETLGVTKFEAGQKFGMSLFVNDNDGFGRKGGLSWGDGIARYNGNPRMYNMLVLEAGK